MYTCINNLYYSKAHDVNEKQPAPGEFGVIIRPMARVGYHYTEWENRV